MEPQELAHLTLQLAILLLTAKLFGLLFKKMKQSEVLGELIAGMVIGPFALGMIDIPGIGPLFPIIEKVGEHISTLPISTELYFVGQIGAVLLLFLVGLETNAKMFMKYGVKALGIGIGGVVLPFFLGAWATVQFGFATSMMDGTALFIGAIMTATSVGITARVLADMYKLDTKEGVSILAAAVIDDVLGILVLALVLNLSATGGGAIDWGALGIIGLKALGFIAVVTVLGIIFAKRLSNILHKLEGKTYAAIAAAIAFLIAALAEQFGLAMIIGAYMAGILISVTPIKKDLEEKLAGASHIIVPVFFAIMGTLVDFKAMAAALVFGLVLTGLAIIGKVIGAGVPAFFSGFNFLGSSRIGIGMLPRGEVALIIAGIGLSAGIIESEIFGVSIMMTIVTTLMAPIILVPLFKINKSGSRKEEPKPSIIEPYRVWETTQYVRRALRDFLTTEFEKAGYNMLLDDEVRGIYEFGHKDNENKLITMKKDDSKLQIDCSEDASQDVDKVAADAVQHFTDATSRLRNTPQAA